MPSNMGIGNARSLAQFHSLLAERKILSEGFYKHFEQPVVVNEHDHVIGYEENKGYGYQFTKNPKVSGLRTIENFIIPQPPFTVQ